MASLNPPVARTLPQPVEERRRQTWEALGADAQARMNQFIAATDPFEPSEPHYHLGMLGVVREHQGRGLGGRMLDAVHALSAEDPESCGVALTTEDPGNIGFYEKYGYRIVGEADVGSMRTWGFYRRDP